MSKALEAIHSRPAGSKPFASRSLSVKALEAIHPSQVGQTFLTSRHVKALAATHSPPAPNPSCAAVDACMSPCHDATIQNPQIALVNVESVVLQLTFFFHEYGRRVGMVPRSSLKEGKNSLMVEKRTRTTNTTQNQTNHSPQAESPPSCSLSSVLGETSETKTDD